MCTPFALIVTGRKTGGDRPDDVPAGCDDFKNFHREQLHNNPCPAFCERSKYKFSMNLSRYWQENPEAPMCKEYPFAFAYANFFWWHLQPGDLVVIMSGCPMLALVAKYCGLKVLIVDRGSEDDVELIDYSLRNLHFMNAPEQTRYLIAHTHHTQPSSRFSERTHARSCPGSGWGTHLCLWCFEVGVCACPFVCVVFGPATQAPSASRPSCSALWHANTWTRTMLCPSSMRRLPTSSHASNAKSLSGGPPSCPCPSFPSVSKTERGETCWAVLQWRIFRRALSYALLRASGGRNVLSRPLIVCSRSTHSAPKRSWFGVSALQQRVLKTCFTTSTPPAPCPWSMTTASSQTAPTLRWYVLY